MVAIPDKIVNFEGAPVGHAPTIEAARELLRKLGHPVNSMTPYFESRAGFWFSCGGASLATKRAPIREGNGGVA